MIFVKMVGREGCGRWRGKGGAGQTMTKQGDNGREKVQDRGTMARQGDDDRARGR